jgi:RNA polymerase sigma factor (sigma-70 family)
MERFNALTPGQPGTEAAGIDLEHELTRGFAARCIRRKAREVVRCAGFSPSDRQDIEQELTLVLLRRLGQFNHRVAHYNAFVTTVVERYVATILEHRSAHMRTHQRDGGSLNVLVDDGDGCQIELSATIPSTQHALRTGCHPRSALEQSDLQRDVRDVMATLTPRQRAICELQKTESISEVARSLNISRNTFYHELFAIREQFEAAGLRAYL